MLRITNKVFIKQLIFYLLKYLPRGKITEHICTNRKTHLDKTLIMLSIHPQNLMKIIVVKVRATLVIQILTKLYYIS